MDVTNPMIVAGTTDDDGNVTGSGKGPLHMFSIYNDTYNNEVIRVDHTGEIARIPAEPVNREERYWDAIDARASK